MRSQTAVLHGQVVIFFLIHLLVDNILFGDPQRTACSSLVDLRSSSSGLDTGFQAPITAARGSNVSSVKGQMMCSFIDDSIIGLPLLVLLMGALGLDRLGGRHSTKWRHVVDKIN